LRNVVEDTTPQLYADLDVNGAGKGLAQGATNVLAVSAGGILSYPTQSACECGLSVDNLHIATATLRFLPFDTEVTDTQGEFDSVRVTGTASGTTANHLIDSAKNFPVLGILVGARVINETDYTVARVTNVANGDLTIDANIMASGETYHVFNSRFTATVDGKYEVILVGEMDNLADNKYMQVSIFKNNAAFSPPIRMETRGANTDTGDVCLVARPTLAAGDIMEFYMYHNVGSTQLVRYNVTHLTITKVL
jgi:hypothetical protein